MLKLLEKSKNGAFYSTKLWCPNCNDYTNHILDEETKDAGDLFLINLGSYLLEMSQKKWVIGTECVNCYQKKAEITIAFKETNLN